MSAPALFEAIETPRGLLERPIRVHFPVLASFSSTRYAAREFNLNLSEGGMFLPTDNPCAAGTRGTITLRTSQYNRPMEFAAEVVRCVEPGTEREGEVPGLGIQFLDVSPADLDRLRQMVEGAHSGTVIDTIRKSLLEGRHTLAQELRTRPTDQKMMLALGATSGEIDALIRDGTPSVLIRLLENPRLAQVHVVQMLRNPQLTTRVLSAIRGKAKFLATPEARFLFVTHLNTNLAEALEQLPLLPPDMLRRVGTSPQLRPQLRLRARELGEPQGRSGRS